MPIRGAMHGAASNARDLRPKNIVCHGNSLTAGASASIPYPAALATLRPSDTITNAGTSGIETPALTAEFSTVVNPLKSGTKRNIVVMWEFINDMQKNQPTVTDAVGLQHYKDYATNAATFPGWELLVLNSTPANNAPSTESIRISFNSLLANDHAWASGFVDVGNDPLFVGFDPAVYFDTIHFKNPGYERIAEIVSAFLDTM
jgi:hypothetical protein